jgi:hypothetical protein
MSSPRRICACVAVLTALIRAQAPDPVSAEEKLAVPVEPIAAIVDAGSRSFAIPGLRPQSTISSWNLAARDIKI